jgi:hypothetical protein
MTDSGPWGRVKSHADMHDKTLIYYEHAVSHVRTSLLILKRAIVWSDTQSACKRHVSMCSAPFHLRRSVDRAVRSTATLRTAHACMLNNCTTSLRPPRAPTHQVEGCMSVCTTRCSTVVSLLTPSAAPPTPRTGTLDHDTQDTNDPHGWQAEAPECPPPWTCPSRRE